jgi:hypothetical protein
MRRNPSCRADLKAAFQVQRGDYRGLTSITMLNLKIERRIFNSEAGL